MIWDVRELLPITDDELLEFLAFFQKIWNKADEPLELKAALMAVMYHPMARFGLLLGREAICESYINAGEVDRTKLITYEPLGELLGRYQRPKPVRFQHENLQLRRATMVSILEMQRASNGLEAEAELPSRANVSFTRFDETSPEALELRQHPIFAGYNNNIVILSERP